MARQIKKLLRTFLKTDNNWKIQLLQNWPDIVGNLKTKVQLEKIQEKTLVLSVIDACWLQELYLLTPVLLKTINEKLDRPRIKRLRFKQAGKKKEIKKTTQKRKTTKTTRATLSLTETSALKKIEDKQLEDALKRFLFRCRQEEE